MRLVTMVAPPNCGPEIAVGHDKIQVVDGRVQVYDIFTTALEAHGFRKVEAADVVVADKDLPDYEREKALAEAASLQAERFDYEIKKAREEGRAEGKAEGKAESAQAAANEPNALELGAAARAVEHEAKKPGRPKKPAEDKTPRFQP